MEERYEIREKIGQGGMGSVFRAYDSRMNREVAIKRIQHEGDKELQEATSQQIIKEAGALALLQHPHIVTVYDVGTDEEGPYVVMELISGKTLDELVERAPLTWPDFRELAMQTQEALIAAQELNLVHRDLKPGNLMLTWLPSGRFQVKIVDFGLANLAESASLDHLEDAEAVYGSIFFMCPEQFERAKLDARSDMYSIGCVYYHALTGIYPFNGETGLQVMTAHLHHQVIPLQEVRPDIPHWACDWVMWHLNRLATDRPPNARESLKVFLQNANVRSQAMNPKPIQSTAGLLQGQRSNALSSASAATSSVRAIPEPPRTQTAPQPLLPPEGSKPSVHASPAPPPPPPPAPAVVLPTAMAFPPAPAPAVPATRLASAAKPANSHLPKSTHIPKAAIGPKVAKAFGPGHAPAPVTALRHGDPAHPESGQYGEPKRRPLSKEAKIALKTVGAIVVALLALILISKIPSARTATLSTLMKTAAVEEVRNVGEDEKSVPVTRDEVDILLNATLTPAATQNPGQIYLALAYAKPTEASDFDIDTAIVNFILKQFTLNDHCDTQLLEVVRKRKNPAVAPPLLEFCRTTGNAKAAIAAIQACRTITADKDFAKFIDIVDFTGNADIRQAAEDSAAYILRKSIDRQPLASKVAASLTTASNTDVKFALIRLLGCAGGAKAADIVKKSLASTDEKEQLAAALALASWPDDAMFETLIGYLDSVTDAPTRTLLFNACVNFVANPERTRPPEINVKFWNLLASSAKSPAETERVDRARAGAGAGDKAKK